jgi:hypothetical protein
MLTDAQKVDVRRWAGYATQNAGENDLVFTAPSANSLYSVSLTTKLDGLTANEEEALTTRYLTPLASLEAALLASADNMDTQAAGPWIANPREVQERTAMYNRWRRDLCGFLGIPPGPALGSGGIAVVRC